MFRFVLVAALLLSVAAGQLFGTEGEDCTHGLSFASIQTFHDAIAPSCHKYMPAKDYETARKHVPNIVAQAASIADLKLDSTYAEVADDFYDKRRIFLAAVDDLMAAADQEDDDVFAKAFDKMHETFVNMTSALVLVPVELDDFHLLVAEVWHKMLPAKDYEGIKNAIPALKKGCASLAAAKLHRSRENLKEKYLAGVGNIESSIAGIEKVIDSKSDEQIENAVNKFHESFEGVIGLF